MSGILAVIAWWLTGFASLIAAMILTWIFRVDRKRRTYPMIAPASLAACAVIGILGPIVVVGLGTLAVLLALDRQASIDSRPIVVMAFPHGSDPYTSCFYHALSRHNVTVINGMAAGRWLLGNLRAVDYVHFHWPSHIYNRPGAMESTRGFAMLLFIVGLARWRGVRILWTAHNLLPHDVCIVPQYDDLSRWLMVRFSARIFVHGPSAAAELARAFPGVLERVVLIDHGHWVDYFPRSLSRQAARQKLGLRCTDFVFLFIGLCKPYKDIGKLIGAFEQMPREAMLVIAGKFPDPAYEREIRAAIDRSQARIILHSGFVPNEDLQLYLRACETVAIPYRDALTSGTALLALSFGRPVVAPALGSLKDVVNNDCGCLYSPEDPDGLRNAMAAAMRGRFDEQEIIAWALKHDWDRSAQIVANCLR
ncbi:MAG: glycosyltransferase family 4 protein [Acidobacteriaceae bacterium]|nr:glycosyltransferase family 4 protein [Acidobacteriaceae bacterium]